MRFGEPMGWHGKVRVTVRRGSGIEVVEFPNLITNVGRNLLRNALGDTHDPGISTPRIRYLAWGTGSTAPAATDTALVAEAGRKSITAYSNGGVGEKVSTVVLATYEANVAIAELGWFAGETATSSAGSGVLVARVLYSRTKDNLESIQIDRTDTIGVP